MEPTAILPAYMDELKTQGNIRVLTHSEQRIVYQIDCVNHFICRKVKRLGIA